MVRTYQIRLHISPAAECVLRTTLVAHSGLD